MKKILVAVMATLCIICAPALAVTQQFKDLAEKDWSVMVLHWQQAKPALANDTVVHVNALGSAACGFLLKENAEDPVATLGLPKCQEAFLQANPELRPDENGLVLLETVYQLGLAGKINSPATPASMSGSQNQATPASTSDVPPVSSAEAARRADFAHDRIDQANNQARLVSEEVERLAGRVNQIESAVSAQAIVAAGTRQQLDQQGKLIETQTEAIKKAGNVADSNSQALNLQVARQNLLESELSVLGGRISGLEEGQQQGGWYTYGASALAGLLALLCWVRYGWFSQKIGKARGEAAEALTAAGRACETAEAANKTAEAAGSQASLAQSSAATAVSAAGEALALAQEALEEVDSYSQLIEWPEKFFKELDRLTAGEIAVYDCRLRVKHLDNKTFFLLITAAAEGMFKISGIDDQGKPVSRRKIQRVVGKASLPDKLGKMRLVGAAHPVVNSKVVSIAERQEAEAE